MDVESYQNPDDGDEIGFWNGNVFERPDMDVIPRKFYEIIWAIVETPLSGLTTGNLKLEYAVKSGLFSTGLLY